MTTKQLDVDLYIRILKDDLKYYEDKKKVAASTDAKQYFFGKEDATRQALNLLLDMINDMELENERISN